MFVECNADEALVRYLTGLPRRQITHELKGKFEICIRLSNLRDEIGMVDEDPGNIQPPYLGRIRISENLESHGIRVLVDDSRNNKLVVLRPKLEDWILRAARDSGLRMENYGLPDRASTLHREINGKLDNLSRLLGDLNDAGSPRLHMLKDLLN